MKRTSPSRARAKTFSLPVGPEIAYEGGVLEDAPGWASRDSSATWSVAWGDLGSDGDLDLACGNGYYSSNEPDRVYLNHNGVLEESASWVSRDSSTTQGVAWGDVNFDGYLDLACGRNVYVSVFGHLEVLPTWQFGFGGGQSKLQLPPF